MTNKQLREFLNSSATKKQKIEALKKFRPDIIEEIKNEIRPDLEKEIIAQKQKHKRWQRISH